MLKIVVMFLSTRHYCICIAKYVIQIVCSWTVQLQNYLKKAILAQRTFLFIQTVLFEFYSIKHSFSFRNININVSSDRRGNEKMLKWWFSRPMKYNVATIFILIKMLRCISLQVRNAYQFRQAFMIYKAVTNFYSYLKIYY